VLNGSKGEFRFKAHLKAGAEQSWTVGVVVESRDGPQTALHNLEAWLPQRETWLAEKEALYDQLLTGRSRLHTPDADFDAAYDLARANIQMLEAESVPLGRYFYAGLEMFPFWFSNDGAYGTPGLLAGGFVFDHTPHRARARPCPNEGACPTNFPPGALVPGNAQETSLWVISIWDAYRWTGDRDFLARSTGRPSKVSSLHPRGDSTRMATAILRSGRREEKTWRGETGQRRMRVAALRALRQMAETLEDNATAARAAEAADRLAARFEQD
jgi:glycogen debranching enzyme